MVFERTGSMLFSAQFMIHWLLMFVTEREGSFYEVKPKEILAGECWCSDSYGAFKQEGWSAVKARR
ncbi:MAG: hypothetical protein NPINA01_21590 [Nitrospinaceae bacterium]|nr:MAG: hypothetical protein NPINA01_21590 [Nitrospinaceae bacterium]